MDFLYNIPSTPTTPHVSGYQAPPLDGSLTVPQIYDWHYNHNPNHPVFVYADSSGSVSSHSFADVVPAAHRAARQIAAVTHIDVDDSSARKTVAILATSGMFVTGDKLPTYLFMSWIEQDTITYFTTLLGMLRLATPVMPISPRFTAPIIAHLLHETGASHILVSEDLCNLARDAVAEHQRNQGTETMICSMPTYGSLYLNDTPSELLPPRKYDYSSPTGIVHSSGAFLANACFQDAS